MTMVQAQDAYRGILLKFKECLQEAARGYQTTSYTKDSKLNIGGGNAGLLMYMDVIKTFERLFKLII